MTGVPAPPAPATWRARVSTLAALEAVALAAWLLPASLHIVQWPASGPVRLALTAPAWQLAAWLAVFALAWGLLVRSTAHDWWGPVIRPLALLWVLAVPYLPWLPDRLPLLLVLAGPIRWWVAAIAVARGLVLVPRVRERSAALLRLGRGAVFAVSLVLYAGLGLVSVTTNGLGGDEPHYLVITESLLRDGDLQIENNHQRGDYRSFFRGDLRPDYMQRGLNRQIYSIHAPGLPALVLPVYAVAGYRGVVAFIALLGALAALAIFDLAERLAGRAAAVLTWLAVCLTVPFVPHAWSVFPEMPGALLVAWGALWLWEDGRGPTPLRWALRGLALAWLPWLHTKFIVFLALFSVGFGLRLLRQPGRLVAVGTPIAVSTALWFYSFHAIYGSWNPEAPYGAYTRIYVLTSNIPHGLLGLFFDQKFGLLVYSPVYLFVLAGIWLASRRRSAWLPAAILLVTVAAFVGSTARLYMFWGGSSAPARFFVPVLPCLAPFVALALSRCSTAAARALVAVALVAGVSVAAVGMWDPAALTLYSSPHGYARILEWLQAGSPLSLVSPTFTEPSWAEQVTPLALWVVALVVALGSVLVIRRRGWSAWRIAGVALASFLLSGSALTARPPAAARADTARRGSLDVLWRFDGERFRPLDLSTFARPTAERLRELTTLRLRPGAPPAAGTPLELGPLQLPPGVFDAEVWFTATRPREGTIVLAEPRAMFGSIEGSLGNPAIFPADVPAPTRRAAVRVDDPQLAAAVSEVRLVPRSVVPPSSRDPRPSRLIESVPGQTNRYLVYTDGEAYPELGTFWTRGTGTTTVLVAPGGAARLVLGLSTGPKGGTVAVDVAGTHREVATRPNDGVTVTFSLPQGERLVPVTVRSSVMFRPSEVSGSGDTRGLGCQVHVGFE